MSEPIQPQPIKPWWQSKLVWLGIIEIALAIAKLFQATDWAAPDAYTLFVIGVLTIAFRWLTDEPVTSPTLHLDGLRSMKPNAVRSKTRARKGIAKNHNLPGSH